MSMLSGIIKTEEVPLPRLLPIAQIRRDGGTQPRAGLDEDTINDYVTALANGAEFPAIDVVHDGDAYWLFDGFHRIETHLRGGRTEILAIVHQGTQEDAQWRSYGANKAHGLRRNTADKERAIRLALLHPQAPGMSDAALARHLGVSDKTVAKYRGMMETTSEIPKSTERKGADGRTISTANIGKARTPDKHPPPAAETETLPVVRDGLGRVMDLVLPRSPEPLSLHETKAVIYRVLRRAKGTDNPYELLSTLEFRSESYHYGGTVNPDRYIEAGVFGQAYAEVRDELTERVAASKPKAPSAPPAWVQTYETTEDIAIRAPGVPIDPLAGLEATFRSMASELGDVCTFSIAMNGGEFHLGCSTNGQPPKFAKGKAPTLIEAWQILRARLVQP